MLQDSFFKILNIETSQGDKTESLIKIELNENHPIYEGHFPSIPVVPGVCQVQILRELLDHIEKTHYTLTKGSNIKHLGIIDPNANKHLDVSLIYTKPEENTLSLTATITAGEKTFLKFKGSYRR